MLAVRTLPLLLWLLGVACTGAKEAGAQPSSERPETTIAVSNQRPLDFVVYVRDGTRRIRLGIVPSMTSQVFLIPAHMVIGQGSLNFQLDPIGSNQVGTTDEALTVREGDALSLTIR